MKQIILVAVAMVLLASLVRDIARGQTGVIQLWGARRGERPVLFWTYIIGNVGLAAMFIILARVTASL